jgi:AAA+ ATPase superfamily predicted ATPase
MQPAVRKALNVFISYARTDEHFREQLVQHLAPLEVANEISVLQDRDIRAGARWEQEILQLLEIADVVLALVSPQFFSSNFCMTVELPKALDKAARKEILLVPVVIRPVHWKDTALAAFKALPHNALPVSKWTDRDDAYKEIAAGLREALEEYRSPKAENRKNGVPITPPEARLSRPELQGPGPGGTAVKAAPDQVIPQETVSALDRVDLASSYDFNLPATLHAGGKFFRGRSGELAKLCNAIRHGKSAVVFGVQRVGKTSLIERALEMVGNECARNTPIVIRVDMFSQWTIFKGALEFFNLIINELARAEGNDPSTLQKLLLDAFSDAVLSELNLQETFRSILRKSRKITGRPILLFIDEFQDIEHVFERAANRHIPMAFDAGVIRWLGSLVKNGDLQMLLGCRFQAKDLDQRERMELFKLMVRIELGPLDEPSARSLIRDPVADSVRYDEEGVRRVVELTGRFPYLIQYMGYELVNRQKVIRTGQVRRKDVEDCADEIVSSQLNESSFSPLYQDFRVLQGGQGWKVLLALAILAKAERQLVGFPELATLCKDRAGLPDRDRVRELLRSLTLTGVVVEEKRGPEPSYYFGSELLRRWLQEQGHTKTLR